jgi:hypothetical protein
MKIFWSWQSDSPAHIGMDFIKEALNDALSAVTRLLEVDAADRFHLDHDTKNTIGWPSVVDTIFSKIDQSLVFIGDATPVLRSTSGKHSLNPNVLLELGYALKALGSERILLIWNTSGKFKPEDLPFDIRHRSAPISYCLTKKSTDKERLKERISLAKQIESALWPVLTPVLKRPSGDPEFTLQPHRTDDPSIWLPPGAKLDGFEIWREPAGWRKFDVREGPCSYVRMVPLRWQKETPSTEKVELLCRGTNRLECLASLFQDLSGWARNSVGAVSICDCDDPTQETFSATQWFENNGEVWSFDSSVLSDYYGSRHMYVDEIWKDWYRFVTNTLDFYAAADAGTPIVFPIRINLGLTGIRNVAWTNRGDNLDNANTWTACKRPKQANFSHTFYLYTFDKHIAEFELKNAYRALEAFFV